MTSSLIFHDSNSHVISNMEGETLFYQKADDLKLQNKIWVLSNAILMFPLNLPILYKHF